MAELLGECPVSTAMEFDGLNNGIGAGRACWMVSVAACHKDAARHARMHPCPGCEFYHRVVFEEEEKARYTFASTHI